MQFNNKLEIKNDTWNIIDLEAYPWKINKKEIKKESRKF